MHVLRKNLCFGLAAVAVAPVLSSGQVSSPLVGIWQTDEIASVQFGSGVNVPSGTKYRLRIEFLKDGSFLTERRTTDNKVKWDSEYMDWRIMEGGRIKFSRGGYVKVVSYELKGGKLKITDSSSIYVWKGSYSRIKK